LHAPLLGVILHAYIKYTEVINNIDTIIVTFPVVFTGSLTDSEVINNINTIIVTLPVVFTGSLTHTEVITILIQL
jgi:non-ribosomal peptide synthetase component F